MRAKTKRALQKRKRERHLARVVRRSIVLHVASLEVALGHDGFLRGDPEPVLVCGVFALAGEQALLIGRGIGRFARPRRYPTVVKLDDSALAEGRLWSREQAMVAVLVIALEEDGGNDIQRAYAMLQSHSELLLIESCDQPNASHVEELLHRPEGWHRPKKVSIETDGRQFDLDCHSDKWIAASAFATPVRTTHRVHLLSPDKRNDWTAVISLQRS